METIKIPLQQRPQRYFFFTILLLFLNAMLFGYASFLTPEGNRKFSLGVASFICVCGILYYFFNREKKDFNFTPIVTILVIAAIVWLSLGKWFTGIVMVVTAAAAWFQTRQQVLEISEDELRLPGVKGGRFSTDDVVNIVLKSGYVTINFEDEKLFQEQIGENINVEELREKLQTFPKISEKLQ